MRHFEYKDDKSSKFWQVEQEGADLNLRWGKIGTQGQSQTKSFADAAKAQAAMSKLIKEKTGKGYSEVTVDASATIGKTPVKAKEPPTPKEPQTPPPVASDPAPAPVISPPAGPDASVPPWMANGIPLDLPDSLMRAALPSRRFPCARTLPSAKNSWLEMRSMMFKSGVITPDFDRTSADLRDVYVRAWQRLERHEMDGDSESDAVLFALACAASQYHRSLRCVTDFLLVARGLEYTLDVMLDAEQINVAQEWDLKGRRRSFALNREIERPLSPSWSCPYCMLELKEIRAALSRADETAWQHAAQRLQTALLALHPERKPLIALLLPEMPQIANALIDELTGVAEERTLQWLTLSAAGDVALQKLNKRKVASYDASVLSSDHAIATLIAERGLDAVPLLASDPLTCGIRLACIGVPEAIRALAGVAGQGKPQLANFNDAVDRWPLAAIPALAEMLAQSAKEHGMLSAGLSRLLQTRSGDLASLMPWMSAAAQEQIHTLTAQLSGPKEVASDGDLPPILVNPPWLKAKKKAQSVTLSLEVLPVAPVLTWDENERKQALAINEWMEKRVQAAAKDTAKLVEELGFRVRQWSRDRVRQQEFHNLALNAMRQRDTDTLCALWRQGNAQGLCSQPDMRFTRVLPDETALALWNNMGGSASYGSEYMLARFGLQGLPGLLGAVQGRPSEECGLAQRVGSAELAPVMARAYLKLKTVRAAAQEWLLAWPEHTVAGLIPPALGKKGEALDCAVAALRMLAAQGHEALLMDVAGRYGDDAVTAGLRRMLDEDPLDRFPTKISKAPAFWQPAGWRRPLLKTNGMALPDAALEHLGTMLRFPTNEGVYAGIEQVKEACDAASLADFAWDGFSAWLLAAAPSKENWAFGALGLFGTDDTARKLTPYIRSWPGESQHQRAVAGLEILNQIGSDVALMLLNGIAQKVKFKGLQDRAREKIHDIAEARDLTLEELEDRLAPDLGLDENGSLLLDFGPRRFRVSFDETLKPFVRDEEGSRLKDLPKPNKSDDAASAKEATDRYKRLKKDARTVAAQQVIRLETAMCQRRRWTQSLFDMFLVRHPLVRHLVQRLVWSVYETQDDSGYGGRLLDCFRIAEDGSLSTADDDEFILPQGDNIRVGIPHALELPAAQAAAFGQLFADYELLQPFVQLGRDTYTLTPEERASGELTRWKGVTVPTGRVLGLANKGWRRGVPQDGGCIWDFTRPVDRQVSLCLTYEPGIIVGMVDEFPEQKLDVVVIEDGVNYYWNRQAQRKPFSVLDDITLSELIRDMESLRA